MTIASSELTTHLLAILEAQTSIAQAPLDVHRMLSLSTSIA